MAVHTTRILAFSMVWLVLAVSPAAAQAEPHGFSVGSIPPSSIALLDALQRARAAHCRTADCVAVDTILGTDEIMSDAQATPMRMGGWSPATVRRTRELTRPSTINRRLRQVLLARPEQFSAVCARIANLLSRLDLRDLAHRDDGFAITLLQTAMLIESVGGRRCLSNAVAAIPKLPENDTLIENAREYCVGTQWHRPACQRIVR